MASNTVEVTLQFVDKFTDPMNKAIKLMEKSTDQAKKLGDEIKKAGDKIANVGIGLKEGFVKPLSEAGVASINMANQVKDSLDDVNKSFLTCEKNAKSYTESIKKNFNSIQNISKTTVSSHIPKNSQENPNAGENISKFGTGLTDSLTNPLVNVGITSYKLANELSTSMKAVDTTFGSSSKAIKKWSNTTLESYGLSQNTALETASTFGNMASEMGINTKESSKMATNLTGLSAQLSSFANVSGEVATNALKGIYSGDSEGLRALGVNMSETALKQYALSNGYKKSFANMTDAQKAQLRYSYVMDNTKKIQDSYSKTSNSAFSQQNKLTEGVKQLGANFGQKLFPVVSDVITKINNIIKVFSGLSEGQQKTIITILGMVAAISPALMVVEKMTTAFELFKSGGLLAMVGPAGIVVGVISAIAVAAFLIIKNWTKIKAFFSGIGKFIKSTFKKNGIDVNNFVKIFSKARNSISKTITKLKPVFRKIIQFLKPIIHFVKNVFGVGIKVAFASIIGVISTQIKSLKGIISGFINIFKGITTFISGVFTGNWSKAWEGVKKIITGVFKSISGVVKYPLNTVIGMINGLIIGLSSIKVTLPKWLPGKLKGKEFSINIPTIPMLAKGTNNWGGGLAITQERGGEIMDLPRGTRVYPHDKSIQMAREEGAKSGRSNIAITISKIADKVEIRNDNDIETLANRVAGKILTTIDNTGKEVFA